MYGFQKARLMGRLTTIKDIAERVGVHHTTVSRAINSSGGVSKKIQNRILKVARKTNYYPNRLARSMNRRKTEAIGFLSKGREYFYTKINWALQSEALEHKYSVAFSFVEPLDADAEYAALDLMLSQRVDGIIMKLSGIGITPEHIERIKKLGVPVVLFEPPNNEYTKICDSVAVDWAGGTKMLMGHVLKLGCKRFTFALGSLDFLAYKRRKDGYCEALSQAGISMDDQCMLDLDEIKPGKSGRSVYRQGYEGARKIISGGIESDVLVCSNDEYAIGAMAAFNDSGVNVPDQIKVTGFDDIPQAQYVSPSLTTICQPVKKIVNLLVSLLMARINGEMTDAPIKHVIQPELIVRNSTVGGKVDRFDHENKKKRETEEKRMKEK